MEQVQVQGVSEVLDVVPYSELRRVMEDNDILLFVETFEKEYKYLARLSFSTKIVDYLSSGKCIFAIGPDDIAPIQYFKNNNVAFVADEVGQISNKLDMMLRDTKRQEMANASFAFAKQNHDINKLHSELYQTLINISKNNEL
jgi:hypothetical protein